MSFVALTMDKNDNLFAVNGRGRPSKERTEKIRLHGELKKDLASLWKNLNMKDGTSILISLSIATDEMQRHVHMFPEVMFLDVIANTNWQKRDLFLMVVKDASEKTFNDNVSIRPCEQKWIFTKLFWYLFLHLYGPDMLQRLHLALTEDNSQSCGAF